MNRKLLSAKAALELKIFIILSVIVKIFAIFGLWYVSVFFGKGRANINTDAYNIYFIILLIILIILTIICAFSVIKSICSLFTYMNIYKDYIEGTGMQGLRLVSFIIFDKDIIRVTVNEIYITVRTTNKKFKIICNEETALKIYEYFNI